MKKTNVILQAAIAGALFAMAGGAQAGTLTGTTVFATEIAGPTATAALAIQPGAIGYTFNTPGGIVINPTGTIYMYQRVSGGLFSTAPLAAQYVVSAGIAGLTFAPTLSADSTTVRIAITNGSTDNVTIGVGGTLTWTPIAGAINSVNTTLATAGGAVNMQASVGSTNIAAPNTGTALPADLDNGLSNTLAFATAAEAITGAVVASSAFTTPNVVETQRIDLTATSPASRFTAPGATLSNANSATVVNLGSVTFTDAAGTQSAAVPGDYTIAGQQANGTALSGTVTGSFKTGSTLTLSTNANCVAGAVAGATALAVNAALTDFTFTGATTPTTAVANYVCLTVPATTGAIPVTTPTATFSIAKATATDKVDNAAGTLYALQQNGATVDVRSYIPAATVGYTSFVRVINTGSVAAAITGQWVYEDGTTGPAATLIASHPGGGSTTLTSTQIEAALGAPTVIGNDRPRLRLTGPTNGLEAQSFFLTNANGNFSDATGAQ